MTETRNMEKPYVTVTARPQCARTVNGSVLKGFKHHRGGRYMALF